MCVCVCVCVCVCLFVSDAKGYTRGFEESIGYKKGYAAGEKLAREQAANMNAAAAK